MFTSLIAIQYCFDYLINQIPVGLLLYSHLPTALVALLFGLFVVYKKRDLTSSLLFLVCLFFALWCVVDLSSWFSFLGSDITMFTWSLADLCSLVFFLFSYYFLYTFVTKKDLPTWQKLVGVCLLIPTAVTTFLGLNLVAFDGNICEAWENGLVTNYLFFAEGALLLASLVLTATSYRKAKTPTEKKENLLAGIGVCLFLGFFFLATLGVSLLVNYSAIDFAYNFEIYGLFGMPILLVYLGYLIVRYRAFDLRIFYAQGLAVTTIAIVAAQYAFLAPLNSRPTLVLNTINLILVAIVSIYLARNVKMEIALRKELELANTRQQETMRFITHEVKGYLTDGAAALDALGTGAFGPVTPDMRNMVGEALVKNRAAVREIQNFLRIADFKTGKVAYGMKPFDFKKMLDETLIAPTDNAKNKGLGFAVEVAPADYTMVGDGDQILNHVIVNLVNNAINYTPKGDVSIHLERSGSTIRFSIKDSGVGLTEDDKKVLFTEGGHGKESRTVNPHSTGYGLFIAKQIVDAHHGRIWAESEGRGSGSTFFVELPTDLRPTLNPFAQK